MPPLPTFLFLPPCATTQDPPAAAAGAAGAAARPEAEADDYVYDDDYDDYDDDDDDGEYEDTEIDDEVRTKRRKVRRLGPVNEARAGVVAAAGKSRYHGSRPRSDKNPGRDAERDARGASMALKCAADGSCCAAKLGPLVDSLGSALRTSKEVEYSRKNPRKVLQSKYNYTRLQAGLVSKAFDMFGNCLVHHECNRLLGYLYSNWWECTL